MGHKELKEIGINAYGHRHKIIKAVERLLSGQQGILQLLKILIQKHAFLHLSYCSYCCMSCQVFCLHIKFIQERNEYKSKVVKIFIQFVFI